jgi:predicted acylesterase/phospholipase RssA
LNAQKKQEDFSLVISGGISLGAYEAGYNWALLKYMAYLKHNSKDIDINMRSIAGASAGAINTLMSSIAWCRKKDAMDINNTIEDNL